MAYSDPQRQKEATRAWKLRNREKNMAYNRAYSRMRYALRTRDEVLEYRSKNREKRKKAAREYYQRNRDKVREYRRKWQAANAKSSRAEQYGITLEYYEILERAQNNTCAICRREEKLCVDHSHATGKVRGLLCHRCNSLLGFARENITTLIAAAKYLGKAAAD